MGLRIDGIATNGALDSSGEILNIEGIDISDLVEGRAVLNWEHEKSSEDTIGAVIYAKKIKSAKDCENERQRRFWELSGIPFVYIVAELFDDEEHPGAVAAAALIRYYAKRKEKLLAGFSIEGQTLTRKGNTLERSVARKVALTLRPCNKACIADVFQDPKAKSALDKCQIDLPSSIQSFEVDSVVFEDPFQDVKDAIESLNKTLTAGSYNSTPGSLVGGSALQVEDRSLRNRVKAAVRDWDRTRPLREVIKAALPELSDNYIDHFTDLAEDLMLKKSIPAPTRIDTVNSVNPHADDKQKELITGLYIDNQRKRKVGPEKRHDVFGLRNDANQPVVIKTPAKTMSGADTAKNATHYYHLARDFFDMQDHVPVTNYFAHNGTDNLHQAIEHLDGKTAMEHKDFNQIFENSRQDGSLHKLALMDMINGYGDRHYGNVMIGKDKKLKHIDNDDAFEHEDFSMPSDYLSDVTNGPKGIKNDMLNKDTANWLMSLDPIKLSRMMTKMKINPSKIQRSVENLKDLQAMHGSNSIGAMHEQISGRGY